MEENSKRRTDVRFEKFILKNEFEPRFQRFFSRVEPQREMRQERPYMLQTPKTNRMRDSPFYFAAAFLNRQDTKLRDRRARAIRARAAGLTESTPATDFLLSDLDPSWPTISGSGWGGHRLPSLKVQTNRFAPKVVDFLRKLNFLKLHRYQTLKARRTRNLVVKKCAATAMLRKKEKAKM